MGSTQSTSKTFKFILNRHSQTCIFEKKINKAVRGHERLYWYFIKSAGNDWLRRTGGKGLFE